MGGPGQPHPRSGRQWDLQPDWLLLGEVGASQEGQFRVMTQGASWAAPLVPGFPTHRKGLDVGILSLHSAGRAEDGS